MANTKTVLSLMAGMVLVAASGAFAQAAEPSTDKFFVNVNFGGQLADRALGVTVSKTIYEETATLTSTQDVNKGFLFDFGGGVRIWGDIFVGVVVSHFGDNESANYTASIPDPIFFNKPKTVTGTVSDLKRTEWATSPHVLWVFPLTDKMDISAALGIAIINLKTDLLSDFDVPAGTQTPNIVLVNESGTGVGPYAAVDFIYNLSGHYGVGGYVRYAGAKVDLPSSEGENVGGMQAGGGIRLRF